MSKRIKLLISPSGIDDGVSYLIYRSKTVPVPEDKVLIEVDERVCEKRVLSATDQVLVQEPESPLYFKVNRVFMIMPIPQVYVDGTPVPTSDVTLFPRERLIKIMNQQIEPGTTKRITMDYQYLASVVVDDPTHIQNGVKHYGTMDEIVHGLNNPESVHYTFNKITKELTLTFTPDKTGHARWYRVYLREDGSARLSQKPSDQKIELLADDFDVTYRIQVARDKTGTDWQDLATFKGTELVLNKAADITGWSHLPLEVDITTLSPTAYKIELQNPWFFWERNVRPTHFYRVRAEDSEGRVTEYVQYPRGEMNYKPVNIRIRRKEHNGNPAQFEGYDAFTLYDLKETHYKVDPSQPLVTLFDDHLVAGKVYSYTFYIDDEEGFRSAPFMETTAH